MKGCSVVALVCVLIFVSCTPGLGRENYEMRIAIGNPARAYHFGWTPFDVFKREAEIRSKGKLKVHLSSQLMGKSSMEMITMVRDGVVHARDFADGHIATLYPPIQVLSIPYLFDRREIAWEVLDGLFGRKLIRDMAGRTGLRPLCWIENGGFRHFSNNLRPIEAPGDMKGLKIRTMAIPLHMKILSDLGARPVPIAWGKVYESIESGLVDGQENSVGTFMIPRLQDIQPYLVLDRHVYGTYALLMNDDWYRRLPCDLQRAIQQAGRICATVNRGLAVTNEMEGLRELSRQGIVITSPSPEAMDRFKQLTRASAVEWLKANVGQRWVEDVLAAVAGVEKKLEDQGD